MEELERCAPEGLMGGLEVETGVSELEVGGSCLAWLRPA